MDCNFPVVRVPLSTSGAVPALKGCIWDSTYATVMDAEETGVMLA